MDLTTRKILDRYFTATGFISILLMAAVLIVILGPIVFRGGQAFLFQGTVEHRQFLFDKFERGNAKRLARDCKAVEQARAPLYEMIDRFQEEMESMSFVQRRHYSALLEELESELHELLGPRPDAQRPILVRRQYGQTRWDRVKVKLQNVLYTEGYDYSDPTQMGVKIYLPRLNDFEETSLAALFPYLEKNIRPMFRPRLSFYWGFLFDKSFDSHMFGGIWSELLGTIYLALGAMIFAVPMGVIAALYLVEYAKDNPLVAFLRVCISTLAGVPSIVFGLFGLAFFINTIHVSPSKSVLAGSLTLALLILPTLIRASEEAIRAVPNSYREAAMGLGAGKWHSLVTVILPAALPGILTGIVISMGRAAGETAPIIFTAAVSVGKPISLLKSFSEPTPALPWNIYNLCTEHEAVDEIRHVQYGMVLTLVALVLVLNVSAIIFRARIARKLKG